MSQSQNSVTETAKRQANTYHVLATTSQATPVAEDLIESLQDAAVAAENGNPDLGSLVEDLEQAEQQLRELTARAQYLQQSQP